MDGFRVDTTFGDDGSTEASAALRSGSTVLFLRASEIGWDQKAHHWFDLLAVGEGVPVDDALPAWCDCGHRTLSRAAVLRWLSSGEHRVVID